MDEKIRQLQLKAEAFCGIGCAGMLALIIFAVCGCVWPSVISFIWIVVFGYVGICFDNIAKDIADWNKAR